MKNILTIDLEDWFCVEIFNTTYRPADWSGLASVVVENTDRVLEKLRAHNLKATFFVLGWVADRYPDLIARVASEGHEIGCHSYHHYMVSAMTSTQFRQDTEMALAAVVKACGVTPTGYRSPSWGMRRDMLWAYEILADLGFRYDSSIYPIHHDIYGDPGAPVKPYTVALPSGRGLLEFPASTVHVLGRRMAIAGGGWLRHFPYWFTRWGIQRLNRLRLPAMVYFHPWELSPDIPRVKLGLKNRFRQYGNLAVMERKIDRLLNEFDFGPIREYIDGPEDGKKKAHP
jgi:polysaccharide deacetylase family protein (PEP-CTERM system associated)